MMMADNELSNVKLLAAVTDNRRKIGEHYIR
jgi:hypothetical protein